MCPAALLVKSGTDLATAARISPAQGGASAPVKVAAKNSNASAMIRILATALGCCDGIARLVCFPVAGRNSAIELRLTGLPDLRYLAKLVFHFLRSWTA